MSNPSKGCKHHVNSNYDCCHFGFFLTAMCFFKACTSFLICDFLCFIVCLSMAPHIPYNFPIPYIPYTAVDHVSKGDSRMGVGVSWSRMGDFSVYICWWSKIFMKKQPRLSVGASNEWQTQEYLLRVHFIELKSIFTNSIIARNERYILHPLSDNGMRG